MIKKMIILAVAVVFGLSMCTGCGGGGNRGSSVDLTGDIVTGTVSAPASISLSRVAAQTAGGDYAPAPGLLVEAYSADENGDKVGETLASATTNSSGGFSIELPYGLKVTPGRLLLTAGTGENIMRAFVLDSTADISPYSEYWVRRIFSNEMFMEKISQSDVPDNMLSLITVLSAQQVPEEEDEDFYFNIGAFPTSVNSMLLPTAMAIPGGSMCKGDATSNRNMLIKDKMCFDCCLQSQNLSNAVLSNALLFGADLSNADLSGGIFMYGVFWDANLSGANLSGASFVGASFQRAYLKDANLTGANLGSADFSGATWTDGRTCAQNSIGACN